MTKMWKRGMWSEFKLGCHNFLSLLFCTFLLDKSGEETSLVCLILISFTTEKPLSQQWAS